MVAMAEGVRVMSGDPTVPAVAPVADRGASIRVPHSFKKNGWKGYLEDRRPNSQGCPYAISSRVLKTIAEVPKA